MSATHIEALAKALYENGNPQHTAEDRAILGPFEELDLLQQTIWIDLANAAHNHMDKRIEELEESLARALNDYIGAKDRAFDAVDTITRVKALTLLNGRPRFGAVPVVDLCTALEGE